MKYTANMVAVNTDSMKNKSERGEVILKIALLLVLAFLPSVYAYSFTYTVKDYFLDLKVRTDGVFEITETLIIHYNTPSRGFYREIPYRYYKSDALIYNLNIQNEPYTIDNKDGRAVIHIGSPKVKLELDQKYTLSYKIYGAVVQQGDTLKIKWDLISDRWNAPVEKAHFIIDLPTRPRKRPPEIYFQTGPSSTEQKLISQQYQNHLLIVDINRPLDPGEYIKLEALFEPDAFTTPVFLSITHFLLNYFSLFIPAGTFWLVILLFRRLSVHKLFLRHMALLQASGEPINSNLPGKEVDCARLSLACLISWGERGFISLSDSLNRDCGYKSMIVEKLNLSPNFNCAERMIDNALFQGGRTLDICRFKEARRRLEAELSKAGMVFDSPLSGPHEYRLFFYLSAFVSIGLGCLLLFLADRGLLEAVSCLISAFIALMAGNALIKRPVIPPAQVALYRIWFTFIRKKWLIENPLSRNDFQERFYRMLPLAYLCGYEQVWVEAEKSRIKEQPVWYKVDAAGSFSIRLLIDELENIFLKDGKRR